MFSQLHSITMHNHIDGTTNQLGKTEPTDLQHIDGIPEIPQCMYIHKGLIPCNHSFIWIPECCVVVV